MARWLVVVVCMFVAPMGPTSPASALIAVGESAEFDPSAFKMVMRPAASGPGTAFVRITDGIRIMSLADPEVPVEIAALSLAYLRDIAVEGNILAGAIQYGSPRVVLYDVSNPAAPIALPSITFSGSPFRVVAKDGLLFVGIVGSLGPLEIYSVDLSNPSSPVVSPVLASGAVPLEGSNAAHIVASAGADLQFIDFSNPAAPVVLGSVNVGASIVEAQKADALLVLTTSGLCRIDDSVPAAPSVLVCTTEVQGAFTSTLHQMAVIGRWLFALGSVFDLDDPNSLPKVASFSLLSGSLAADTPASLPPLLYQAQGRTVVAIDVTHPTYPSELVAPGGSGAVQRLAIDGDFVYAVGDEIKVLDVADPQLMQVLGELTSHPLGTDVALAPNDSFYVAHGSDMLLVDASDRLNPAVGHTATIGTHTRIASHDANRNYTYASNRKVIDWTTPSSPSTTFFTNYSTETTSLAVADGRLFDGGWTTQCAPGDFANCAMLVVYDLVSPLAPSFIDLTYRSNNVQVHAIETDGVRVFAGVSGAVLDIAVDASGVPGTPVAYAVADRSMGLTRTGDVLFAGTANSTQFGVARGSVRALRVEVSALTNLGGFLLDDRVNDVVSIGSVVLAATDSGLRLVDFGPEYDFAAAAVPAVPWLAWCVGAFGFAVAGARRLRR